MNMHYQHAVSGQMTMCVMRARGQEGWEKGCWKGSEDSARSSQPFAPRLLII